MGTHRVLLSDTLSPKGIEVLRGNPALAVDVKTGLSVQELADIIGSYDALVVRSATKVTREVIERAHSLKVIGRAGVGVDNVDLEAATRRGIVVMNSPSGNSVTTAEHAISMMMALARHIPAADASTKRGGWEREKFLGIEVCGKILGVARLGIEQVSLTEIYERSDFITVHTPLTEETRGMIGDAAITRMKPGVRIINCARGGIVDETALLKALKTGKVAGAALDVFVEEPPPPDHPLLKLPNVITTPHLGAATGEAQVQIAIDIAQQITDFLLNGAIRQAVNIPTLTAKELEVLGPHLKLGEQLGRLAAQIISEA